MTALVGRAAGVAVTAVLAVAPAAQASAPHIAAPRPAAPHAAPPGDNGDVKIHAVGASFVDERNEPHVCRFYLDAFNFDPNTEVSWHIDQQGASGDAEVLSGTLKLKSTGAGVSNDYTLPAGHYQLTWNFVGEKGSGKHKTFWSDCAGVVAPPPGSVVVTSGGTVVGTVTSPGMVQTPSGHVVPLHQALAGRTLPRTGSDVLPTAGLATALALGGVVLVRRSRRGRSAAAGGR